MTHTSLKSRPRERGVVLLFCLIVLVILLAGGVAVMRSMNNTLFSSGNLAFKRDLLNQGDRAISLVMTSVQGSGLLASSASTQADNKSRNYKASVLPTNAQGIPDALLADASFADVGVATNDIEDEDAQVKIRYLIDRLCDAAGVPASNKCVQSQSAPTGGTAGTSGPIAVTSSVYRLTIRISGPRSTQVFVQTSFTMPD